MTSRNMYVGRVLSLQQQCMVFVKKYAVLYWDSLDLLPPLVLIEIATIKMKKSIIAEVCRPLSPTPDEERFLKLEGKTVFQCCYCSILDGCSVYLKDPRIVECPVFSDTTKDQMPKCFCDGDNALFPCE